MRLQKLYYDIENVVFDAKTYLDGHSLHINRDELIETVADKRFADITIGLAIPGESCRIMNPGDIVQPTLRLEDEKATFPGAQGEMRRAGNGKTIALRGVAVAEVCERFLSLGCFLDMSGPGAEHTPFSETINICIDPTPAAGVELNDYLEALKAASLKAAAYLAKAAKDHTPDAVEEFALEREGLEGLPRVAYIFQIFNHAPYTDTLLYGDSGLSMLPVVVHPNEILDGALVNRDYGQISNADPTFVYQNHPMILELYRRHGKDVNFVGVVVSNTPHVVTDKNRNAMLATGLVKYTLKADAVIITKEGGGHPQVDIALICDDCEGLGVKTAILISEFLSPSNATDETVLFTTKNADAMVAAGCLEFMIFPPMEKAIGGIKIANPGSTAFCDPHEAFRHRIKSIRGGMSQLGGLLYTSMKY